MSLTEVVFELADAQYPLCRFTAENPGTRAVYRVIESGATTGSFRATLTLLGATEATNPLLRELRATKRYDELDVLAITPYAIMLKIGHRVADAQATPGIGVQPIERFAAIFGPDTILEPIVIESGRMRARCLVPQPLDTKRVLVRLQELQRSMAWEHFRVVRVAEFKAREYADTLRRILSPDQEDLLRLALSLGYYDSPKRCTLEDIARKVGLSVSPIHKKLKEIEQTLINSHVDPASVTRIEGKRPTRAIATAFAAPASPGSMSEIAIRIRWRAFAPLAFTAKTPGARVILQGLGEDERARATSSLFVVVAPEKDYRELVAVLESKAGAQPAEVTSRDSEHVSFKLRAPIPSSESWWTHVNPFSHLVHRFGREAFLKPIVIEGEDLWLRFIVVRSLADHEIRQRLEAAAKEAGWDAFEITSLRRVEVDPAVAAIPQPEKMTPRQEEVLKIAHALGYYKTPRESTLEGVANTLGISANAIHKNLTAAEQKIICGYLSAGA